MFVELTQYHKSSENDPITVNPANITFIEEARIDTGHNTRVHFYNTSRRIVETREQINAKVDEMREEMMEGMMPDLGDMGGML